MSFSTNLHQFTEFVLDSRHEELANELLMQCIDLTLLQEQASQESLAQLEQLANAHPIAAVCVYPDDLQKIDIPNGVHLATVINFPGGKEEISHCIKQIKQAQQLGAHEIDYVVPYSDYLNGKKNEALVHATKIAAYCNEAQLSLKLILETGAFSDLELLYEFASELLSLKIDFLKTSTGKINQGASLSAAFTLLSAIKDSNTHCGIKISGGVKTKRQANHYALLAQYMLSKNINKMWFRIGASSLLADLSRP